MNIEDLKEKDTVEAKCLECGELHLWEVQNLSMAPRVVLHVTPYDVCVCKRQLVYAAGIERVVTV